jgi:hypothetical protein
MELAVRKPKIDRNFRYPEGIIPPWVFGVSILGYRFYDWQAEFLEAWGQGLPCSLCAANGSGKTQIVITTALLWFFYTYPKGIAPVTSGSERQLNEQLWPALLAHEPKFRRWHWTRMRIETDEGGRLILFSTKVAGLAEGYHGNRLNDSPCAYIIDEAKSVDEGIFLASDRCTVQYRMLASSPGEAAGRFYESHSRLQSLYYTARITSFQCKHITDEQRALDRAKLGEASPTYRSKHLGEFTDDEGPGVIISRLILARCIAAPPIHRMGRRTGFCDFAAGTDENVFAICDGNKVEIIDAWCEDDTMQACQQFIKLFERFDFMEVDLSGDNGGLGKSMIDRLGELGWHIRRVDFGGPARDEKTYANRSSEIWFESIREIEKRELILPDDQIFFDQATTRRREYDGRGRLMAEPKKKMMSRGLKSPDRADAVLGSLWSRRTGSISCLEDLQNIHIPHSPFVRNDLVESSEPWDTMKFS